MENKKTKAAHVFSATNIIYACVLLLALAAAIVIAVVGRAKPVEIPDENGEESYALAVLTEKEICAREPRYSCRVFGITMDEDKVTAEAGAEFSGVAVLAKIACETESATITVNCKRTKGNVRIVLLDEKMNIVHDFAVGESSAFTLEGVKGKSYEVRIAGESAEFNVTTEIVYE